jgi:predicted transposase YbfD/YdcC
MTQGFIPVSKPKEESGSKGKKEHFLANEFRKHFANVKDPRIERTKAHNLLDIIAIALLAVLSGADGWEDIEAYGEGKSEWLKQFLELPNGIPSHDTFSRVFARINPKEFQESFLSWLTTITEKLGVEAVAKDAPTTLAIDGKTLKGSYDREEGKKALHLVSAWSSSHRLILGQQKVKNKSNEITAIPELLEMLSIEGAVLTLDAMGCQKEIASLIIRKKADYILCLKANHKGMYERVFDWFQVAREENFVGRKHDYYQEVESGHHRIEKREVWVVPVEEIPGLDPKGEWKGLKTIVMVIRERVCWNKTTRQTHFYLSSWMENALKMAGAIRSHWGIENSVHWILDVTFAEDKSRIRKENAPENFALLRRLALNILKQDIGDKRSVKRKRYLAGLDNDYLLKILSLAVA